MTQRQKKEPKEPKLTKAGLPRKPHVMTEKRQAAFAKCVQARLQKQQAKKMERENHSSKEVDNTQVSTDTIDVAVEV